MEIYEATEAFASLAQETRLKVLKLLIEYGRQGVAAGVVADELKIPNNTLSFHLAQMSRAGLVHAKRQGRSINYMADAKRVDALIGFLKANCCVRQSKSTTCKQGRCSS